MQNLKHLRYFDNYIAEQDMMGAEPGAAVAPKEIDYIFIFIEEGDEGEQKYPDGSSTKVYPTYSISKTGLDSWISSNVKDIGKDKTATATIDIKKDAVSDYISGRKSTITPDNKQFLNTFKNQVKSEQVGERVGDTEVTFYGDGKTYGTDKIDVTFIVVPKK